MMGSPSNASTAATYGTKIGSQQTNMLQAQDAGLFKNSADQFMYNRFGWSPWG